MVGAEEARPSAPLLADYDFTVPPSPVPLGETSHEPKPLGAFRQLFGENKNGHYVQFYAPWPLECVATDAQSWIDWSDGKNMRHVVMSNSNRGGSVVVIADTQFATNANMETGDISISDNTGFWRWLLTRVVPGQTPWEPPPLTKNSDAKNQNESEEDANGQ
jgi:hypothetical protein